MREVKQKGTMLMPLLDIILSRVLVESIKDEALGDLWEAHYRLISQGKPVLIRTPITLWRALLLIWASVQIANENKKLQHYVEYPFLRWIFVLVGMFLAIPPIRQKLISCNMGIIVSFAFFVLFAMSNSYLSGISNTSYLFDLSQNLDLLVTTTALFFGVISSSIFGPWIGAFITENIQQLNHPSV